MTQGTSKFKYLWVVLFIWQLNEEFPFSVLSLDVFKGTEFPMYLINGPLSKKSRMDKYTLAKLAGKKYSIFMKIQEGRI